MRDNRASFDFSARLRCQRSIAKGRSVCPSVTLVSHAYTVHAIKINFAPYDKAMFLVSESQIL